MLADLHGGGNQDDELVQLEFNEIKNQVRFPFSLLSPSPFAFAPLSLHMLTGL